VVLSVHALNTRLSSVAVAVVTSIEGQRRRMCRSGAKRA
jgi:hypothetical protein